MKYIFIFFFIILLVDLPAQVSLDSGLVAYYPFNGNAEDKSGNENHGMVFGAVLSTDRFGVDSAAFEFDGTSSYISVPNSATLQSPDSELTQVAWIDIYSWSLVGSQFGPLLMKSNSGGNAFQYRFSVGDTGINTAINNWNNAVTIFDTLKFDQWYMVATTLKEDTVRVYLNGIFIGKGALSGPIAMNDLPLEIGRDVPGSTEIFHGKIDEIRIYNRALNETEIANLAAITTDVQKTTFQGPAKFHLSQNYPNPFNPRTTIAFSLPSPGRVVIEIYNLIGQRINILLDKVMPAGEYHIEFDASQLPSGLYFYRMTATDYQAVKKMVLMQ
jgi:hypothetical protein